MEVFWRANQRTQNNLKGEVMMRNRVAKLAESLFGACARHLPCFGKFPESRHAARIRRALPEQDPVTAMDDHKFARDPHRLLLAQFHGQLRRRPEPPTAANRRHRS